MELRATATADVTENQDNTWTLVNRRMRREYQRRAADAARKKTARCAQKSGVRPAACPGECPDNDADTQTRAAQSLADEVQNVSGPSPGSGPTDGSPNVLTVKDHHSPQTHFADTITDLASFLLEKTGKQVAELDLENLADETSADAVVTAVEARAGMGRSAFAKMVHGPIAALRHSIEHRTTAEEPGSFERWRAARRKAIENKADQVAASQRVASAGQFAARATADRRELVAAYQAAGHKLEYADELSGLGSGPLAGMLRLMLPHDQLVCEAAAMEAFAIAREGVAA